MSTTIEQLELEVKSSSTSAVSGIDALASSLGKLKAATKGGVGLTAVTKQLNSLNTALGGVSSANVDGLNKFADGLKAISSCGNIKLSPTVARQITEIGTAVRSLSGTNYASLRSLANALTPLTTIGKGSLNSFISQLNRLPQAMQALNSVDMGSARAQIKELVSVLSPLSQMGKNNLTSFVTQLNKIPQVLQNLKGLNFRELYNEINSLVRVVQPLANEMWKISQGFSSFPRRIQRLVTSTNKLTVANGKAATSYISFTAKIGIAMLMMRRFSTIVGGWITKSNEYIENLNLFTVSMGSYASQAKEYAEIVGEVMGIDPGEWMRNQGIFMTLASGFGVASDRAYLMSKNLTQLGYDLASFFNISFEDSMQKLQSGLAGELEPLRRLGFDLSVARLQQEAYTLGINKSVNAMSQAEKSELRYYAIMTQVTTAQGDMARTLVAPANQLRILQSQLVQTARALGNIFIPALNAVLPYAIALAKVIRLIADTIAKLLGFKLPEIDYGETMGGIASGAEDVTDNLGDAVSEAKALKNALLGIDELNIITPPEDSSGGGGVDDILGGGGLGFKLPEYDFLGDAVTTRIDGIVQKMKEWLGLTGEINTWGEFFDTRLGRILETVGAIGLGFAAWKISKNVIEFLNKLSGLGNIASGTGFVGLLMLVADIKEFIKYFKDFAENGATFQNVVGMLSEFTGAIGDCLLMLGSLRVGASLKVVQGIGEILVAIKDISDNGINWSNVTKAIRGISNLIIGIGILNSDWKRVGKGLAIQGLTTIISELADSWEAIKEGDWSGVDKAALAIGAIEILGGIAMALDAFSKLSFLGKTNTACDKVKEVVVETDTLNTTMNSTLLPKLASFAKTLGMGLVIILEVAAAALIITGAIALLGMELEQVGIAWEPVIANGGTVAEAMGIGIGVLVGIGAVTALLGSFGGALIAKLGIGIAVLAEVGVAAAAFLAEIWGVAYGLLEIGNAWAPVLANGETIASGIKYGTILLVGIGLVTALLGMATVATAGLIPVAIGLGTVLLVELAVALVAFTESLVSVADELSNNLAPSLEALNAKLPALTENMSNFVDFMIAFAGEVVLYTGASAVSGLSATIDTIVGWFTQDPIDKMSDEVAEIGEQAKTLNDNLNTANPELQRAITLLNNYTNFVDKLGQIACKGGAVELSEGLKVNLEEVGENIVTGFADGIANKYSTLKSTISDWGEDVRNWFTSSSYGGVNKEKFSTFANDVINGFKDKLSSSAVSVKSSVTTLASNIKTWFTSTSHGAICNSTWAKYAKDIVDGFKGGVTVGSMSAKTGITTWANNTKKYFTDIVSYKSFTTIGKDVVRGFNDGVNALYTTSREYMEKWANDAKKTFKKTLDSHSPSKVFMRIGYDTVLGYNNGITALGGTTKGVVNEWADSFTSVSPTMSFAVDTSALKYYNSDSFAKSISTEVTSSKSYSVTGFKEGMEEFYREYMEPTMAQLADDMRRQADKSEQTIVQIGNKVVTEAVTTQRKANGFAFVR